MLTKQDLQAIKEIVNGSIDERVPAIIEERVPQIINQSVPQIINQSVPQIINQSVPQIIDRRLKPIKSDIRKIKKDLTVLIARTDRKDVELQKRVEAIERHTGLITN